MCITNLTHFTYFSWTGSQNFATIINLIFEHCSPFKNAAYIYSTRNLSDSIVHCIRYLSHYRDQIPELNTLSEEGFIRTPSQRMHHCGEDTMPRAWGCLLISSRTRNQQRGTAGTWLSLQTIRCCHPHSDSVLSQLNLFWKHPVDISKGMPHQWSLCFNLLKQTMKADDLNNKSTVSKSNCFKMAMGI